MLMGAAGCHPEPGRLARGVRWEAEASCVCDCVQCSQSWGRGGGASGLRHSLAVEPQPRRGRAEGAAGSGPRTFLHLLAGSGSSSVSDELEEPGSLSASGRKRALGKQQQVRHLLGPARPPSQQTPGPPPHSPST